MTPWPPGRRAVIRSRPRRPAPHHSFSIVRLVYRSWLARAASARHSPTSLVLSVTTQLVPPLRTRARRSKNLNLGPALGLQLESKSTGPGSRAFSFDAVNFRRPNLGGRKPISGIAKVPFIVNDCFLRTLFVDKDNNPSAAISSLTLYDLFYRGYSIW